MLPMSWALSPVQAPLVGAVGQEYVHSVLTSMNPQNAVKEIQKNGAFRNKRCRPVLELLGPAGPEKVPFLIKELYRIGSTLPVAASMH